MPALKGSAFVGKNLVIRPLDYAVFKPMTLLEKQKLLAKVLEV